ncbi:hypothetical protein CFP56_002807 [Quercus suber]|uniref:Uncharacterized protein n=1 Tax=Quercus suber TaxID=58331 RepID=A0AAW0IJC9_QUESU
MPLFLRRMALKITYQEEKDSRFLKNNRQRKNGKTCEGCDPRVLDLYDTRIISLPSSISDQINLRVLYLNNCGELMELPSQLEKLKSLEILDLPTQEFSPCLKEPAQLTGLKCLRVSFKQNFIIYYCIFATANILFQGFQTAFNLCIKSSTKELQGRRKKAQLDAQFLGLPLAPIIHPVLNFIEIL